MADPRHITVYLRRDDPLRREIERRAAAEQRSLSAYIRILLAQALKKHDAA